LFSEVRDCSRITFPEYGTPHPDHKKWPHHKLVFIQSVDIERDGLFEFFYAADRENQDLYNWEVQGGEVVIRSYLVPRALYYGRSAAEAASASPVIEGEFTYPVVATPDPRFPKYGFADDTVAEAPENLSSRYIVIRRRFLEPVTVDYRFDESLQRNIKITKRLIPKDTGEPPVYSSGLRIEVQNGNVFHDVEITQETQLLSEETYPLELAPLPSYYDMPNLPSRLDSVRIVYASAWASAKDRAPSFSEDYYFKYKIIDPRPGPYSATVRRFVTDDPEAIKEDYPLFISPQPVRESVAIVNSWFFASVTQGCQTSATAKEITIPPTVHNFIVVSLGTASSSVDPENAGSRTRSYVPTLAATPGVTEFFNATIVNAAYTVRPLPLGLYEVSVTQVDISNLYPPLPDPDEP
jgi:hypothetical protein